jgi:hypothetical protein
LKKIVSKQNKSSKKANRWSTEVSERLVEHIIGNYFESYKI